MFGIDDAPIGAGIGALGSIAGGLFGGKSSTKAAQMQIAAQREAAQNKFQWAVADMEKAGLNPKLAGTQAASIGSSVSGSGIDPGSHVTQGISGAANILANAVINSSSASKNLADANLAIEKSKTEGSSRQLMLSEMAQKSAQTRLANAQADLARIQEIIDRARTPYAKHFAKQEWVRKAEEIGHISKQADLAGVNADILMRRLLKESQEFDFRKDNPWFTGAELIGSSARNYGDTFNKLVGPFAKNLKLPKGTK
ncbi:VP2 [Gokushovirus WZ-2015a]|nr:VP2 [Gokushovirus WZ-2015a]ALS03718.1 VP2 [Gokushovirus WZ-2015a]